VCASMDVCACVGVGCVGVGCVGAYVLGVQSKLGLRMSLPLDHSGGGKVSKLSGLKIRWYTTHLASACSSRHSFFVSGRETDPSRRKFRIVEKCFPLRSISTQPRYQQMWGGRESGLSYICVNKAIYHALQSERVN